MRSILVATLLLIGAAPVMAQAQGPARLGFSAQRPRASLEAGRSRTAEPMMASVRQASPAAKGALVGGLIGLAIGVLAVASADSDSGDSQVVLAVPAMALIGAGIGALIGSIKGRG